jgi:hypothetical protein
MAHADHVVMGRRLQEDLHHWSNKQDGIRNKWGKKQSQHLY